MDSKRANEEMLNALHHATATQIAKMLKEAEGEPELMLKVLREARGFLKDNNVTADVETNKPLRQLEGHVKLAELPFEVEKE